ncbi:MAG: sugar transferase [Pseudomonadota bacterium]
MSDEAQVFEADVSLKKAPIELVGASRSRKGIYLTIKRLADITVALLAMPVVISLGVLLALINPIWNKGPLIYAQKRMGRRCRPFMAYKFRTMTDDGDVARGPNDPLEEDRITPLGLLLRRFRIDEFPQFINVLFGEMSVIGPRPDYWEHAIHYTKEVPGYRRRHAMRPGITGLAQVDNGYAEGITATSVKTEHDLRYIATASLSTDFYVLWRTVKVMATGFGAR